MLKNRCPLILALHETQILSVNRFLHRFSQHILPKELMRIRQHAFLTNACQQRKLALSKVSRRQHAGTKRMNVAPQGKA